ncbi:caspase Dronc isoform X2 [Procambarus clarkii]|uniref:caspase Dronc isoform X2 n=1 Tax=Procambarus clarkii TaxID=6728 RepID=UPI003742B410
MSYRPTETNQMEVFEAIEEGKTQRVRELIQDTGPAIRRDNTDCTLLHVAAASNQLDVVLFLLKLINPNIVNKEGRTPAHLAAIKGHTQVLRILLADEELNHDKRDNSNRTYKDLLSAPLFEAVLGNNRSRVQELLKLGVDPDYHAGSLVEGLLEEELQVVTARHLALTLNQEPIIRLFAKERPPEKATEDTNHSLSLTSCELHPARDQLIPRLMMNPRTGQASGPDVYKMDTDPRGYVCILSYSSFKDRPDLDLEGSHSDVNNLSNVFGKMGYTGHSHSSLTAHQTKQVLTSVRDMEVLDHVGCAVFVISSHGVGNEKFLTNDMKLLTTEWVCGLFKDSECPRLKHKPKLFIFDFCCGYYKDQTPRPCNTAKYTRVEEPLRDMMCLYSNDGSFTSYTFTDDGTPFITALCRTLAQHAQGKELGEMYREFLKECTRTSLAGAPQLRNFSFVKQFYFNPVY